MFGLFKNKRQKFNDLVDTKLNNGYEIQTRDNPNFPGVLAYLELLDVATKGGMNEHEAAMYVATLFFCGLCKHGHTQEASILLQRITRIAEFEIPKKMISQKRWEKFASAIAESREQAGI